MLLVIINGLLFSKEFVSTFRLSRAHLIFVTPKKGSVLQFLDRHELLLYFLAV
jgi:hypothetical protein